MSSYHLHTENARQALEAISKGLSSVRISTDLNISERDFSLSDQSLVLDEDNRLSINDLKKIVKKTQRIYLCREGGYGPVGRP